MVILNGSGVYKAPELFFKEIKLKILVYVVHKIRMFFMYAGLIFSFIFLGIGTLLMDSVLKTIGVEKGYLLSTDLLNWSEFLTTYIKTMKVNNTEGENKNV